MTVEVWYPLGVAGAGASFAAGGLAGLRSRLQGGLWTAIAAGALGAIVVVDLIPDVHSEAAAARVPAAVLLAVVAATFGWLRVAGRRGTHPCGAASVGVLGPAFLIHGFLEGMAGGTIFGWHASIGAGLVLALVLHKTAEGADLGIALSGVGESPRANASSSRRAWLVAAAVAPLLGCGAALLLPLRDRVGVVSMTAVCCILAAACLRLLRRAHATASGVQVGTAAMAGAAAMCTVIALA